MQSREPKGALIIKPVTAYGMLKLCVQMVVLGSILILPYPLFASGNLPKLAILENSPQALRFSVEIPNPTFSQQQVDNQIYDVIQLNGFVLQHRSGATALPALSHLIILPPDGHFRLSFVTTPGTRVYDKHLLPSLQAENDPEADSVRYRLTETKTMVTLPVARLVETGIWRGFRLGRLEITPVQILGEAVHFFSNITVVVEFDSRQDESRISGTPITPVERLVLKSALNFAVAQQWRMPATTATSTAPLPFQSGPGTLKIAVEDDGFYHISYRFLDSLGLNPATLTPASFQIWNKGQEVPILLLDDGDDQFEPGEAIQFWGEQLHGEGTHFNHYAKQNIYWLTFSAAGGRRIARRMLETSLDPPPLTANYFWDHRHFEQEKTYYYGDSDAQVFSSTTTPGETWIWQKLNGGDSFTTGLTLPNPVLSEAPPCSLRVRIRGTTVDPATPSHHLRFSINNNSVGEIFFDDTEEVIFQAAFPNQWLRESNNIFQLFSINDTGAQINQVYLDWIEIGYWRQYHASDNMLICHEPQNSDGTWAQYKIDDLPSANVILLDRRNNQKLEGFTVTQTAAKRFQMAFIDSANHGRDYLVLTPQAYRVPAAIWLDSPSTLRSTSNAADYILITHAQFRDAAERLAQYRRQQNGRPANDRLVDMRIAVVDIEDIYDEFNHGIAHPQAIRDFLQHAYWYWQKPAPIFVCLFGDASLDPNLYEANSYKHNFIFSFGNPASDNRLVCLDGPDDFLPEMLIGRIPVETPTQARMLVEKIIFYEQAAIAEWNKTFIFLNGGISPAEQEIFRRQSELLIARHVLPGPISGRPVRIYKSSTGVILGELKPEILSAIDAGAVMVTFSGHAGSQTWELMIVNADIAQLRNRDVYPFIASMTCHTARFANSDQNSFGEEFLRPPDKGAIAFWGTSGYGFAYQDGFLLDSLYSHLSRDTVRYIGVATTLAKIGLWQTLGNDPITVNSIDQYTLLGDPALQLALPTAPDLSITPADIAVSPGSPTEDDVQTQISVKVRNLGLATTDSADLALTAISAESETEKFHQEMKLGPIGWADSISAFWFSRGNRGDFRLRAEVDRAQEIAESNETNNVAERTIYFAPSTVSPAAPMNFGLITETRPILRVYNPATQTKTARTYFFEIDTTTDFNSTVRILSPAITEDRLRTGWQVPAPLPDHLYFWRSRTVEGERPGPWQMASFWIEAQSPVTGFRQQGAQLREGIFDRTVLQEGDGAKIGVTLAPGQKQGTFRSVEIGPAKAWQVASSKWRVAGGSLHLTVLGRSSLSNTWQVLKDNLTAPEISLVDIEAAQFPFLRLQADFRDDDGMDTPVLHGWTVGYEPCSDFATGPQVVSVSADSVLEGETVKLAAEVFHFGSSSAANAEEVRIAFSQFDPRAERGKRLLATYQAPITVESSREFVFDWNSAGSHGENLFFVEIDPDNQFVEPVEFNNTATFSVFVRTDQRAPRLEVTFDGQTVIANDYISPQPTILCKIFDDSLLPIADTSQVQVFLDENRVAYSEGNPQLQLVSFSSGPVRAQVTYRPQLTGGRHVIEFFVHDASNNPAYYRAEVQVDTEFHLREVMNYPNPFSNETDFTYYLTQPAEEVTIKIFTLSGRLIATLDHAPTTAGFNRIHWNGRDADGDVLANGVYLYKITARLGERRLEEVQKCVVMR
ncbi:MAG: C25 family cysteine peptidase [candidate division KSB1 bacterium]|nr:C25 family cysteine peptidase [candidate division KSB1 bacterium]MDZ7301610.1 C25 family cysteine peptidase [candidate division KSB1 bacterium]MDZ7310974.1 C25 family cysteine peptidase [candidate division KSB1 bacterium]